MREQTKEKIDDKVTKKRISLENLADHQEICKFQHKTLDNQRTILKDIIGAIEMKLVDKIFEQDRPETFSDDSFGQGVKADFAQHDASGVQLKWENGPNQLLLQVKEIDTSEVQRLKKQSLDEAFV